MNAVHRRQRRRSVGGPAAVAMAIAAMAATMPATAQPLASAPWPGAVRRAPTSHALLLGVGSFESATVPPLPGVAHDLASARALALAMGVPAERISTLRDGALTLAGLQAQLQALVDRVQPGDRVFVYWSGHGTRYRDTARPGSPCVTSLLAHDGQPLTDGMLAEALLRLAARADKLFVFVDACFSGGAVAPARGGTLRARFFARSGPDAACGVPTNQITRSLQAEGPGRWPARGNLIYLTAARDSEIAFEEAGSGGFATRAYRDCALREARDLDGSGQVSVAEVAQCAQQRIDQWLAGHPDFRPHHLTLFGNRDFVPQLAPAAPVATAVAEAAPAAVPAAPPAPPPSPSPSPSPSPPPVTVHPERTLRDIHALRDDRRQVRVQLSREALRTGRDNLGLTVTSSHAGFLYLLYVGSDGRSVDMLFPNQLDQDNFVPARRPVRLPRDGWRLEARGPAGTNHLLAIVSDMPRDFSGLGWQPAGAFSSLAATMDGVRTVARQAVGWGAPAAPGGPAASAATASPVAQEPAAPCSGDLPAAAPGLGCSSAFGSALLSVRELP